MGTKKFITIDEYHASFPMEVQKKLEIVRRTIKKVIPNAEEVISYNMPAFKLKKVVVFYAAFQKHLSLFPAPGGRAWEQKFKPYRTSGKGTIQFPLDKPVPVDLIREIVEYRKEIDAALS